MSREVRRVPLGWRHPTEPNPYWISQTRWTLEHKGCLSLLRLPQVRFRGLSDGYPERLAEWQQEVEDLRHRRGHDWDFGVKYHLTGYQGREDSEPVVHPLWVWNGDGQEQTPVDVRDEDHLHALLIEQKAGERPDPAQYMPVFDDPASVRRLQLRNRRADQEAPMTARRVDQTIFASDPKRQGNCVAACVASLLGLELVQVPHFIDIGQAGHVAEGNEGSDRVRWWYLLMGFMAGHGLWPVDLPSLEAADPGELVFVAGPSERGVEHQVIYRDGNLWHDPHPSRAGVLAITEVLAWRRIAHDHTPTHQEIPVA